MTTLERICIKDYTITDKTGFSFTIQRGKAYLTGTEDNGFVHVFSSYWVYAPIEIFAGEQQFT